MFKKTKKPNQQNHQPTTGSEHMREERGVLSTWGSPLPGSAHHPSQRAVAMLDRGRVTCFRKKPGHAGPSPTPALRCAGPSQVSLCLQTTDDLAAVAASTKASGHTHTRDRQDTALQQRPRHTVSLRVMAACSSHDSWNAGPISGSV